MWRFILLVSLNFGAFLWQPALGAELECYACSYNYNPDVEPLCLTNPEQTQTVLCDTAGGRGCYIKSQYDMAADVIRSFQRGCEIFNHIPEGCSESAHFEDCLAMCYDDLCNGNPIFTSAEPFTGSTEEHTSGGDRTGALMSTVLMGTLMCVLKWFLQ